MFFCYWYLKWFVSLLVPKFVWRVVTFLFERLQLFSYSASVLAQYHSAVLLFCTCVLCTEMATVASIGAAYLHYRRQVFEKEQLWLQICDVKDQTLACAHARIKVLEVALQQALTLTKRQNAKKATKAKQTAKTKKAMKAATLQLLLVRNMKLNCA